MRWKFGHDHHPHDPRQIDLLAVCAIVVVTVSAFLYVTHRSQPPSTTAFIVPSQTVRW